jgi:hypothetical protein
MTATLDLPTVTAPLERPAPRGAIEEMPGVLRTVARIIAAKRPPMPARVETSWAQWADAWYVRVTMPGDQPLPEVTARVTAWANALGLGAVTLTTQQGSDGHWFTAAQAEGTVQGIRFEVWDCTTVDPPADQDTPDH